MDIIKIDFRKLSEKDFAAYEDAAIDGRLIYDKYPAEEYKYFSQLSKLGYKNRHDGWSKEICEQKQQDIKRDYLADKERSKRFFCMACKMQANIRRGEMLISRAQKSETPADKLRYAMQALELMTCEDGLCKRSGQQPPDYSGCDYCAGLTQWAEKLSADGEETSFNFCPVCGRIIEEVK